MNIQKSRQMLHLCILLFAFGSLRSVRFASVDFRPSFNPIENTASFIASRLTWRCEDNGSAAPSANAPLPNMWMRRFARVKAR